VLCLSLKFSTGLLLLLLAAITHAGVIGRTRSDFAA